MFIIIEAQQNADGTNVALTPAITKSTYNEAQQAFHQILAAAAVSAVPVHSAVILTGDLSQVEKKTFYHGVDE